MRQPATHRAGALGCANHFFAFAAAIASRTSFFTGRGDNFTFRVDYRAARADDVIGRDNFHVDRADYHACRGNFNVGWHDFMTVRGDDHAVREIYHPFRGEYRGRRMNYRFSPGQLFGFLVDSPLRLGSGAVWNSPCRDLVPLSYCAHTNRPYAQEVLFLSTRTFPHANQRLPHRGTRVADCAGRFHSGADAKRSGGNA
jgi:hypothetical protein